MPFTEEESLGTYCNTWKVTNWSNLEDRVKGPTFETEDLKWNLLLYPKGNNHNDTVSLYLALNSLTKEVEDEDFHVCAQFLMLISSPDDPTTFIHHAAQHRFQAYETDWGFTTFISQKELTESTDDKPQFLVNDTVILTTIVRLIRDPNGVLWHNFLNYDSKKTTGYVGLYNQGATCYMNSLFQSLYFTNYFRLAVYQIPTDSDEPSNSTALALQRLFFSLQFSNYAVSTIEVTRSFGWNTVDAFMQRDVQEFNRLLQDNLERKMKGTPAEGSIQRLFVGKMKSYIRCVHVDYESSRSEDFYDIQLNVKNCKNLEESFKNYIEMEILEGDNKYSAEDYGLQDAKKGVIFESFPPVLQLQLKRFEYDMLRDTMLKINDRHEFPSTIDLTSYLSENADMSISHIYALHGVLVHTGDSNGGHYFSFVRPTTEEKWFKFDDDRVTPATLKEVLEDNYGGERLNTHPKLRNQKRFTNAYMLIYIRESSRDEILREVSMKDIPEHLVTRFEKEQAEIDRIKRQRAEQELYIKSYIVNDNSFLGNTGSDFIQIDEDDKGSPPLVNIMPVRKDVTLKVFTNEIAKKLDLNSEYFKFWILFNRENNTVRLGQPLEESEGNFTMEKIREIYHEDYPYLRFYIEKALIDPTTKQPVFPDIQYDKILIFIKLFDQASQSLQGLGKLYVSSSDTVYSIEDKVNKMCGFEKGTTLNIFEEIDQETIILIERSETFEYRDIFSGDIFCVERQLAPEEIEILKEAYACTDVADYLLSLYHQILITFVSRENSMEVFDLILRTDMLYSEFVFRLAKSIQCHPAHIRLMIPDVYGKPKSVVRPIRDLTLMDIIQTMPPTGEMCTFFYDVLPMSQAEFEKNNIIKVNVCYPTTSQVNPVEFIVKENTQLSEISVKVQEKFNMVNQKIRYFTVKDHKIETDLEENQVVTREVYAECISEEELQKGDEDFYINVFHYSHDARRAHSIPFKFLVIKDELFEDSKKRLQKKTGLEDKEWKKVKFGLVTKYTMIIKDDDYKLSSHKFVEGEALGLNHSDPTTFEKNLFIKE
ncbi:unnamed protein product [Rhizopus stolonifer]